MPQLLTLPREIRDRIYDFYLQGLTLQIKQKELGQWRTEFKHEGLPNILSLTRVNRQIAAELRPMIPSKTRRLVLGGRYYDDYAEPISNAPRKFLGHVRYLEVPPTMEGCIEPEYSEVIRALPSLQHITYGHVQLSLEEFFEDEFPEHNEDWEGSALRPIVDLVTTPTNFALLRRVLEARFRDFWESNQPSFYAREYQVKVCQIMDSGEALWVCNTAYLSHRIVNANVERTRP